MPQLAWSSLILGVVFIVLGIPLAKRRVAPNGTYGFRTQKTTGDPAIWYEANAYAGRAIVAAGAATLIFSLLLGYGLRHFSLSNGEQLAASLAVEAGPLLLAMIASFRYLARL